MGCEIQVYGRNEHGEFSLPGEIVETGRDVIMVEFSTWCEIWPKSAIRVDEADLSLFIPETQSNW